MEQRQQHAGNYLARATLRSMVGAEYSNPFPGEAAFTINTEKHLNAEFHSNKPGYACGEEIILSGVVQNTSRNWGLNKLPWR